MTIKSDKMVSLVVESLPSYCCTGSFIYRRNPVLMLRGFAFDMPPGGCYIWKYYLPLFGNVEFLHMSLGYRLADGFLDSSGQNIENLARKALDIISRHDDFSDDENINDIVNFAKGSVISPAERANVFEGIECFQKEDLESILKRAQRNQMRLGVVK